MFVLNTDDYGYCIFVGMRRGIIVKITNLIMVSVAIEGSMSYLVGIAIARILGIANVGSRVGKKMLFSGFHYFTHRG